MIQRPRAPISIAEDLGVDAPSDAPSTGSNAETAARLGMRPTPLDDGFVVPLDQNPWWLDPLPVLRSNLDARPRMNLEAPDGGAASIVDPWP